MRDEDEQERYDDDTNDIKLSHNEGFRIVSIASDIERKEENRVASRLKRYFSSGPLSLLSRYRRSSFIAFAGQRLRMTRRYETTPERFVVRRCARIARASTDCRCNLVGRYRLAFDDR